MKEQPHGRGVRAGGAGQGGFCLLPPTSSGAGQQRIAPAVDAARVGESVVPRSPAASPQSQPGPKRSSALCVPLPGKLPLYSPEGTGETGIRRHAGWPRSSLISMPIALSPAPFQILPLTFNHSPLISELPHTSRSRAGAGRFPGRPGWGCRGAAPAEHPRGRGVGTGPGGAGSRGPAAWLCPAADTWSTLAAFQGKFDRWGRLSN